VVIGAGGIGLGVIQGAKLAGASPVIAVDVFDHKLAVARSFGATHAINSRETDFSAQVRAILGGQPDVVIDGTGNPEVVAKAFELTAKKGRTVLFGVMRSENAMRLNTLPLHFGKVLTGSEGGGSRPHEDIPRYLRMMKAGLFDPKPMISHRGALADVNALIARMRAGEVIHAILHYPALRAAA
jgi:S-(hydroxymethyl)glutathione dehydrogenase / alcohol dehydrogenase